MQGLLVNMAEHSPPESLAFEPSDTAILEFSPTIGVVLDFMILYRMEADPRHLAHPTMNRTFRTDEYGILNISSQFQYAHERELAVRRHLTREFKLHGFEMNLIENDGEFTAPFVDDGHPNALHCEDPLHCRWSFERTYTAAIDAGEEATLEGDARLRDVRWLALRLVSPAMAARAPGSLDQLGRAVRLLNGYWTFVNESCEFNLHYGNGLAAFGPRALKALAQAVWLIDPLMDTYHPEHRRDVLYPPYSRAKIDGRAKRLEGTSSAASRSNLANHMTAADVCARLRAGEVCWGQEMWDEARLEADRPPPQLDEALAELRRCASTFSVAALMAPMPRPSYDFNDYLWREASGDYLVGGPQVVLRQHRPTLDGRLVGAWALFWVVFFDRALAAVDGGGGGPGGGDVVAALGPLAAYHRELRASDGHPLLALPRAQAHLRQFLGWLHLGPVADLWRLPPRPVEPL